VKCFGCQRTLEVGDQYIEDTASGFTSREPDATDSAADSIMADLFGGRGGKVLFCADCTEPGGKYQFQTVHGDEDGES
jgi:hypothetical protein